ncbi:MAG TPA: prepilin-type N-terminal cleavage/methylation domain-containing protein [Candidatus Acidoferrum sp.]|jgi:prepilin-type N-terminal cleavage/methylation domain-containing protein
MRAAGITNSKARHTGTAGFSLIELLIVVAIILIIAAIAIPSLLKAHIAANEASAVTSVHSVVTGELVYATIYPAIGASALLSDLGPGPGPNCPGTQIASCIVDTSVASGNKSGYTFTYVQDSSTTPSTAYTFNADPTTRGVSGQRSYYADQSNVTRVNPTAVAGPNDPPL